MQRANTRRRRRSVRGSESESRTSARLSKLLLVVGGLAFFGGLVRAYFSPATGYELSIYGSTPALYWVGIGVAVACALLVGLVLRPGGPLRWATMVVGGFSILSVAALPLIRGYFFYGMGDSLTHLGWAKDIASGTMQPTQFLYPGVHTMTLLIETLTGMTLNRTMLLVVLLFVLVYFVTVPLCVGVLVDGRGVSVIAAFSALLLLPSNDLGVFMMAHPFTQALYFTPVLLYLALRHILDAPGEEGLLPITATDGALAFASVALVLLHPQQALNVAIVFLLIGATRAVIVRRWSDHPIAAQRSVLGHGAFLMTVFLLWTSRLERAQQSSIGVVQSFFKSILQTGTGANDVATQATSLSALGGSTIEVVVKLFLPTVVFGLLAAGLVVRALVAETRGDASRRSAIVVAFGVATAALTAIFGVFYLASSTAVWGRYVGAVVLLLNILGCVALVRGRELATGRLPDISADSALAVVFALLIVLSTMTFFMSPLIYLPSSQVPETEMAGYEASFENVGADARLLGVRLGPGRYSDAVYGREGKKSITGLATGGSVPPEVFNRNLTTHYNGESDVYVVVKRSDERRELELYRGLMYNESGFRSLNSTAEVSLVQTTGDYKMYQVSG